MRIAFTGSIAAVLLCLTAAVAALAAPAATYAVAATAFSLLFLAWIMLRVIAIAKADFWPVSEPPAHTHDLPDYTVIVAPRSRAGVLR